MSEDAPVIIGVRLDPPLRAQVEGRASDFGLVPRTIARDLRRFYELLDTELQALGLRPEQGRFIYRTLRRIRAEREGAAVDPKDLLHWLDRAIAEMPAGERAAMTGLTQRIRSLGPAGAVAVLDAMERVGQALDGRASRPDDDELTAQLIANGVVRAGATGVLNTPPSVHPTDTSDRPAS